MGGVGFLLNIRCIVTPSQNFNFVQGHGFEPSQIIMKNAEYSQSKTKLNIECNMFVLTSLNIS